MAIAVRPFFPDDLMLFVNWNGLLSTFTWEIHDRRKHDQNRELDRQMLELDPLDRRWRELEECRQDSLLIQGSAKLLADLSKAIGSWAQLSSTDIETLSRLRQVACAERS